MRRKTDDFGLAILDFGLRMLRKLWKKSGIVPGFFPYLPPGKWMDCDSPGLADGGGEPCTNVVGKPMTTYYDNPFPGFDHDSNVAAMSRPPLVIS